jgi:cytochrome c peroxidase
MTVARALLPAAPAIVPALVCLAFAGTQQPAVFPDPAGTIATIHTDGSPVALTGPFFEPLASSGRSCATCHRPAQDWTISTAEIQTRFEATKGLDPIFRTNDGSNCDRGMDVSTLPARRAAYSLLRERGLIRMALPVPANAEFEIVSVENPYGCNDRAVVSAYRRPLPVTNLHLLSTVMWDGRESVSDLTHQALDAATRHAQATTPLSPQQQQALVDYEMNLVTAQTSDRDAGRLDADGAIGGPAILAAKTVPSFVPGINDRRGGDPHGIKAENAFRLFDEWSKVPYGRVYQDVQPESDPRENRRAAIVRGQVLFDQKPFDITDVAGFNDDLNVARITGACGTCHNSPNAGNHSTISTMDTGVAGLASPLDIAYLPRITLRNRMTQETKITTDPGRALITGRWKDIGRMKAPTLRGLAARAPYFHNGSAGSLMDVVNFYDSRFHIGFSAREKDDLVAFLSAL